MISRWKPLVYTHRIKNWERKEAKILSMVLETKNTSKISDLLLLRLFPWVPSAFERILPDVRITGTLLDSLRSPKMTIVRTEIPRRK